MKKLIKKLEFQNEYEAYMKQVTDSFINMQSERTTQEHLKDKMSQMLIIEWNGGLEWKCTKSDEMFRDGNLMEENREYNSEIAKEYLQKNILSYDEWIKKYKKKSLLPCGEEECQNPHERVYRGCYICKFLLK